MPTQLTHTMSQESLTEYSSDEDAAGSDDPDVASPFIGLEKTDFSNTTLPGSNDSEDEHCLPSLDKLAENALFSIEKLHVIASSLTEDLLVGFCFPVFSSVPNSD